METVLVDFSTETDLLSVDWNDVLHKLEELTRYCQDVENRSNLDITNFKNLATILETLVKSCVLRDNIFVEAFRFLRNSVVKSRRNQDAIRTNSTVYDVTRHFLQSAYSRDKTEDNTESKIRNPDSVHIERIECSEDKLLAIRCSLQFLANSMVDNEENAHVIVDLFMEELNGILSDFNTDEKIIQYTAMVIHLALKMIHNSFQVPSIMIGHFLKNLHLELVVYAMESLVALDNLTDIYETLEPETRIRLLNFLNARSDLVQFLNERIVTMLKLHFIERSDFILKSKLDDRDNTFCWEIAVLLEVLCSVSVSESENVKTLKSDDVLVTTLLYLLRQIHEAGKANHENDSVFSPVDDLNKLTSKSISDEDDIRAHPTFLFKANLIRLIANLTHRSTNNQNKVRELECLPIILDSCKIDARNPFIAQWSVLAIRNLCEGNEDNQAYIREVQRVDTEKLIPSLGVIDLSN